MISFKLRTPLSSICPLIYLNINQIARSTTFEFWYSLFRYYTFLLKPSCICLSSFPTFQSINKFSAKLLLDSSPLDLRFNTLDIASPRIKLKIITTEYRITLTEDSLSISSLLSTNQPSITKTKLSSYSNFWSLFLSNSNASCLPTLLDSFNSELLADALLTAISDEQTFTLQMQSDL